VSLLFLDRCPGFGAPEQSTARHRFTAIGPRPAKRKNVSNVRDRIVRRARGAGPGDRDEARGRKTSRGPAERRFDWAATGCPVIEKTVPTPVCRCRVSSW